MNGHHVSCDGCVPCEDPGCSDAAYCVNEWPVENLCTHHAQAVCSEHWPGMCPDCQHQAFAEMAEAGDYDPRHDPFYRPERKAVDDAYWAAGPREVKGAPGIFTYPKDIA